MRMMMNDENDETDENDGNDENDENDETDEKLLRLMRMMRMMMVCWIHYNRSDDAVVLIYNMLGDLKKKFNPNPQGIVSAL